MSTSVGKAYHHGDLRRALVTAGRDLVAEVGPARLTLRAVAARAGVSAAAPYRHFADKEALLAAVAESGFTELGDMILAVRGATAMEELEGSAYAYQEFAAAHPELYQLMFGASVPDRSLHAGLAAAEQRLSEILASGLAAAQLAGVIAMADPADVMIAIRCMMHGLASMVVDGRVPPGDVAGITRRVMNVVNVGLLPR